MHHAKATKIEFAKVANSASFANLCVLRAFAANVF